MATRTPKPKDLARAEDELARAAESYPGVIEEGPWGHRAFKIQKKTFMFLSTDNGVLSFSLKLPTSGKEALSQGFAQPTRYGLGKAGWITARFPSGAPIPLATIVEWIDESFRAIAPKKVQSSLPARSPVAKPSASKKTQRALKGTPSRPESAGASTKARRRPTGRTR